MICRYVDMYYILSDSCTACPFSRPSAMNTVNYCIDFYYTAIKNASMPLVYTNAGSSANLTSVKNKPHIEKMLVFSKAAFGFLTRVPPNYPKAVRILSDSLQK